MAQLRDFPLSAITGKT